MIEYISILVYRFPLGQFRLFSHTKDAVTQLLFESTGYFLSFIFSCQVGIYLIQHLSVFMAGCYDDILPRYILTAHDSRKGVSGRMRVK